jgi:hypothetical protein
MKTAKSKALLIAFLANLSGIFMPAHSMGLRSLVALPVESGGAVVRLSYVHIENTDSNTLSTNIAYGLSAKQTFLVGLPYRLSPSGSNQLGDFSALYRHTAWQQNRYNGTSRLGLLGGAIVPTQDDRDGAIQAGFVLTHVNNRHEFDVDALYQDGLGTRPDSGRYDMSWQYRLLPSSRPDWGISPELNSVLELNARWNEASGTLRQATAGLQWVSQKWVLEAGIVRNLNATENWHYLLSTRFHL